MNIIINNCLFQKLWQITVIKYFLLFSSERRKVITASWIWKRWWNNHTKFKHYWKTIFYIKLTILLIPMYLYQPYQDAYSLLPEIRTQAYDVRNRTLRPTQLRSVWLWCTVECLQRGDQEAWCSKYQLRANDQIPPQPGPAAIGVGSAHETIQRNVAHSSEM